LDTPKQQAEGSLIAKEVGNNKLTAEELRSRLEAFRTAMITLEMAKARGLRRQPV